MARQFNIAQGRNVLDQPRKLEKERSADEEPGSDESSSAVPRCPSVLWTEWEASCYLYVGSLLNQSAAQDDCQAKGSNLVSITSAAESDFVKSLFSRGFVWIGLFRNSTGNFVWKSGESVSYTNWQENTPPPADSSDCFIFHRLCCWATRSCNFLANYMCERPVQG